MSLHTKRSPLTTSGPSAFRPRRSVACERRRPTHSKRRHCAVDLVDDGQKVVRLQAASPMNLVHADGLDPAQFAVRQAPLDKPFHRPIHRFPTGLGGRLSSRLCSFTDGLRWMPATGFPPSWGGTSAPVPGLIGQWRDSKGLSRNILLIRCRPLPHGRGSESATEPRP